MKNERYLLNCPFCGGKAKIVKIEDEYYHEIKRVMIEDNSYYVVCTGSNEKYCALLGARPTFDGELVGEFTNENEAAESWNKRL